MATSTLSPSPVSGNAPAMVSAAQLAQKYPTPEAVLVAVSTGAITPETAGAILRHLAPTAKVATALHCKVGQKGGVSLYGINSRFPVVLYVTQWERLLDYADEIRKFIAANIGKTHTGVVTTPGPDKGRAWSVVLTREKQPKG